MTKEKPPIYDKDGRVVDPDLARNAAEVEDKYHKRWLGIFKPSKEKITEGMDQAERSIEQGQDLSKKRLWWDVIDTKKIPNIVKQEMEKLKKERGWLFDFTNVSTSDIGGGITRYRAYAEELISSTPVLYDNYELILDLRDGSVEHEEIRKLEK